MSAVRAAAAGAVEQDAWHVDTANDAKSALIALVDHAYVALLLDAFTEKWSVGSRITAAWLLEDAADSPIVEDENQNTYALFMMYRFWLRRIRWPPSHRLQLSATLTPPADCERGRRRSHSVRLVRRGRLLRP